MQRPQQPPTMPNDLYLGDDATGHVDWAWRIAVGLLGVALVFFVPYWVVFVLVAVVFFLLRAYELLLLLPLVDVLIAVPYGPFAVPLWGTMLACVLLAIHALRGA